MSKTKRPFINLFQPLWLVVVLFVCHQGFSQAYADPEYYLIDSLDLNDLDTAEQQHINTYLADYHQAESDSLRLAVLAEMIEGMRHYVWETYNDFLYDEARSALNKEGVSSDLKNYFRKIMAGSINDKGYLVGKNGNPYKAVDYYMQANKMYTSINDSFGMAVCYINAATSYYNAGELELSNEMEVKGLNIGLAINDHQIVSTSYGSLAIKYLSAGYVELALENGEKALNYARQSPENRNIELSALVTLAKIHAKMEEDAMAQEYFQKAIILSKDFGDIHHVLNVDLSHAQYRLEQIKEGQTETSYRDSTRLILFEMLELTSGKSDESVRVSAYNALSKLYYLEGDYLKALVFCDSAYFLSEEMNNLFKRKSVTRRRYLVFKKLGRHKDALQMFEEWESLRAKMDDDVMTRTITQNEMKLKYTVQATKDSLAFAAQQELATREIAHQNSQIRADRRQKWILYIGLALIAAISLILFKKFRQTKEQNVLIEDQKSQIEEVHDEMTSSIQYAKRLQDALLPPLLSIQNAFPASFVLFQPKDIVSGDFYWFDEVEDVSFIAVADCTGHGVPGAMVSVVCNNALNRSLREFGLRDPGKILNKTRELVIAAFAKSGNEVKDGMDIALCAIHKKQDILYFSGANNPLWIVRNGTDEMEVIKGSRQPVGLYANMEDFKVQQTAFVTGDTLYLFSDGYADQFGGEKGKKLKYKPFKRLLLEQRSSAMEEQAQTLDHFMKDWKKNHPQVDDICIIGIQK